MPCKNGTRQNIEESKRWYAKERELDKSCPFRALWRELVDKAHNQPQGFSGLSEDEKLYFSVGILLGEVYNGGFVQFFDNSSGEYYRYAELGLIQMGAVHSLALLRQAKTLLFGEAAVPKNRAQRCGAMQRAAEAEVDQIDSAFYKDPDGMDRKTESFAVGRGLVKSA
jgi:hypothetical protein